MATIVYKYSEIQALTWKLERQVLQNTFAVSVNENGINAASISNDRVTLPCMIHKNRLFEG